MKPLPLIKVGDACVAVVAVGIGIVTQEVVSVEAAISHKLHLSLWMWDIGWRFGVGTGAGAGTGQVE